MMAWREKVVTIHVLHLQFYNGNITFMLVSLLDLRVMTSGCDEIRCVRIEIRAWNKD